MLPIRKTRCEKNTFKISFHILNGTNFILKYYNANYEKFFYEPNLDKDSKYRKPAMLNSTP